MKLISIVIPVYNEEKRLGIFFPKLWKLLSSLLKNYSYEIVLVNDGSHDGTVSVVDSFIQKYGEIVRLVGYKENQGKGFAIKRGMESAQGDYIFFTDIDLSVDLIVLPEMISLMEKDIAVVISSRKLPESQIPVHQRYLRERMGRVYVRLANLLLGTSYSDFTCGLKGFRKEVGKKLFSYLTCNRWSFDAEILFLAKKFNYTTQDVPVTWVNNFDSKVRLGRDVVLSFYELVLIRVQDLIGKYV